MKILLFGFYVLSSVAGLVILKRYLAQTNTPGSGADVRIGSLTWVAVGAMLYLGSFVLWLLILRCFPLSTAYPLAVGLTLSGTTAVSVFMLRESMPSGKVVGILLIIAGVIFVSRDS